MQRQNTRSPVTSIAKAGCAGFCAVYLVFFAIFLGLVGSILIGTSYTFTDDFFESSNRAQRIAGIVILVFAAIALTTGIYLCYYVGKVINRTSNSTSQPGTIIAGPVVTGQAPPGPVSGYHATQPAYPQGQVPYTPPAAGQPYAPPPQPYAPPPQPYAPAPQQQPYPSPPQQPYPPAQTYPSAPPAQYPPAGSGYPPAGEGHSPAPPTYNEATGNYPVKGPIS